MALRDYLAAEQRDRMNLAESAALEGALRRGRNTASTTARVTPSLVSDVNTMRSNVATGEAATQASAFERQALNNAVSSGRQELPMMDSRTPINTGPVTLSNTGISGDWQGLRSQIIAARSQPVRPAATTQYETSFTNAADRAAFERPTTAPGTQLVPSQRQWYGAGTGLRGAEPTARSLEDMTLGELFVTGLGTRARRSEVLNQTAMEQNALMARGQDINLLTAAANAEQARAAGQAQAAQQQREFALDVADKASLGSLRQAQAEQARRGKLIPITIEEPSGQIDPFTKLPIPTKKQYLYNSDTGETIDPQANLEGNAPAVPSQVAIDEMTKAKRNNAPNLKEMEAEYLATFGALPY